MKLQTAVLIISSIVVAAQATSSTANTQVSCDPNAIDAIAHALGALSDRKLLTIATADQNIRRRPPGSGPSTGGGPVLGGGGGTGGPKPPVGGGGPGWGGGGPPSSYHPPPGWGGNRRRGDRYYNDNVVYRTSVPCNCCQLCIPSPTSCWCCNVCPPALWGR